MRSNLSLALLALTAMAAPAPALGQAADAPPAAAAAQPAPPCQTDISKRARPALANLQAAVAAQNAATIPGLVTAAQAVATTGDEKCFIALMQLKAAIERKDLKAASAAAEAQLASGAVPPANVAKLFESIGQMQFDAGAYDEAAANFERSLQLAPGLGGATVLLAETRVKQNRKVDALPLFESAIALEIAAGRKPAENWYKRPIAIAFEAKNPAVMGLARTWVAAYPSAASWRDAIRLHASLSGLGHGALLDMYRLARLNRALTGDADYGRYADAALAKGFPGEAKAVLDEGFAASAIDRNQPTIKEIYASATIKAAGDRAALDTQAQNSGTAKSLMTLAEAYYGYGDYAKAATLIRAAQGKPGVDAELANLRLGMALASSGDRAGAKAALDLVTGSHAEVARYWQTYLATRL